MLFYYYLLIIEFFSEITTIIVLIGRVNSAYCINQAAVEQGLSSPEGEYY